MATVIPPMHDESTHEDCIRMYWEYCDLVVKCNPKRFLPIGVNRRWWHLKLEHPRTKQEK